MEKDTAQLFGGIIIHKEADMTSFDVIRYLRKHFPGQKWGHSGTLDPFATGVLVILLGNATRLQDELHLLPKTYRTTITLGANTDTDDATGKISPPHTRGGNATTPTRLEILVALKHIKNQTFQIPPDYSAIKIKGQKMYDLAREGKSIVKKPRPITIHDIHLEHYSYPTLEISVTCSTGTYIRSIARDIGEILGTGGYCSTLTRTAIGPLTVENSFLLQNLPKDLTTALIQPEQLVSHIPSREFSNENVAKLKNGREVETVTNDPINMPIALLDSDKKLFGIGIRETEENGIVPKKIFR